jgi:FlaA1/EpsC-like NDP-sugar epimerase
MLNTANVVDDYLKTILPDKLRIDRNYIRSRSLLTDLDVIFMTLLLLAPRLRKTNVPVSALYWGPIAKFASRSLNWFLIDTVTAFLAMGIAAFLWRLSAPFDIGLIVWIFIAVAVGLGFSLINSALGLTRIQWRRAPAREVIPLAFSCFCATLLLIYMDTFVLLHTQLPLAMLALTGLFSFSGFTFTRYRERLVTGFASFWLSFRGTSGMAGERVLLVGAGNNSQLAIWFLTHSDYQRLFSIVGIVDDDPRKQGLCFDGYQVIGTSRDLCELVEKHRVDLTLFTITNIDSGERQRILNTCQGTRARVVIFPDVMANLASYFQPPRSQQSAMQNANYTEAVH